MIRREFITLLGGAAAWPAVAHAQQPAMPVIGLLSSESADLFAARMRAFYLGLGETGFVEGQNVAIEYRWAEGQNDRLPALAADLVRRQVAVIAAPASLASALAARAATTTIPIVFLVGADPIGAGLVASLNRPGRNLTGITSLNVEVAPKRLELLHELAPTATIIALLLNPTNPINTETESRDIQNAARSLGLQLRILHASRERDFNTIFASLAQLQAGALIIGADPLFVGRSEQLAALTVRYALPAITPYREFAAVGGLMSYGSDIPETFRLVGRYAGRILKGEKPADLPVQQSTKVELVINLKTAKALGLIVPLPLLGRADEVIE
jgi:putative tryptophan/tyrosine transport system substrate-binding protein